MTIQTDAQEVASKYGVKVKANPSGPNRVHVHFEHKDVEYGSSFPADNLAESLKAWLEGLYLEGGK